VSFGKARGRDPSQVRYAEEDGMSGALSIMTDSSRLYSSSIARFMAFTMVETDEPSFSNCSAQ
jgi:hypothetical protein